MPIKKIISHKSFYLMFACLLFLSSCAGERIEYQEIDENLIDQKFQYTVPVFYKQVKKSEHFLFNKAQIKYGRVIFFEHDIETFEQYFEPNTIEEIPQNMTFKIVASFVLINTGYKAPFAGREFKHYVIEDENGIVSTQLQSVLESESTLKQKP